MNIWQDLIKTAVVGTQRQELKITPLDNQLGEVLNCLDTNDKEGTLLSAAGTISLYQQAGKLIPMDNKATLETCDLDDLPCCNQLSEQHLAMILNGEYSAIISEWLKVLAESGKVVSPRYLPDLLNLGKRQHNLRKDILPVLGKRGIWLAMQNPEWNYVIGENIDKTWKNGSLEVRKNLLKELRELDAEKGRTRLQNIWSKQKAQERASLLEMLEYGLSIDDEIFLEDCLDDRSKLVRDVAARLLVQIPDSKLVKRMISRVRPLLSLDSNRIEIVLPKECTLEMIQDGIDESKYIPSLGEKASLLLQMLSSVPPSIWSNDWRKTPDELIKIVGKNKWEKLFLSAWVTATIRSQNTSWAEALLKVSGKLSKKINKTDDFIPKMLNILPYSQVQNLILNVLEQNPNTPFHPGNPAFALLIHTPYIWNEEISQAVISSLKHYIEGNDQVNNWLFGCALERFSLQIEPDMYHKAADILRSENCPQSVIEAIDRFLATLQFRYEMKKALIM